MKWYLADDSRVGYSKLEIFVKLSMDDSFHTDSHRCTTLHNHASTLGLLCTFFPSKIDCKLAFHKIRLVSLFNREAAKFVFSITRILGQNGPMCFGAWSRNPGQREGPLADLGCTDLYSVFLHLTKGVGHANQILREHPDGKSAELTPCTGCSWQGSQDQTF